MDLKPFSPHCASASLMPGCSTITIIAIPSPTRSWDCPKSDGTRSWFYLIPREGEPRSWSTASSPAISIPCPAQARILRLAGILGQAAGHAGPPQRTWPCSIRRTTSSCTSRWWTRARWSCCAASARRSSAPAIWWRRFEASLTEEQIASHFEARDAIDAIMAAASRRLAIVCAMAARMNTTCSNGSREAFKRENLVTDDLPIVAVNANSGNPHYGPRAEGRRRSAQATSCCSICGPR